MAEVPTLLPVLRYALRTDRGLVRPANQDSAFAGPRLIAVADGMGGAAAGDVASTTVIAAISPLDEDAPTIAMIETLRSAVDIANQHLRAAVEANPAIEGMGTTLTAMLFAGTEMAMVHIGDSRAYLLRDGRFAQLTRDDTYVQMLVDQGKITLEEAHVHPQKSYVSRVLQGTPTEPAFSTHEVHLGDRYMICSDGLSGVMSAETIESVLNEHESADECADRFVELALRAGAPDNVTVVIADAVTGQAVVDGEAGPPVVPGPVSVPVDATVELPLVPAPTPEPVPVRTRRSLFSWFRARA